MTVVACKDRVMAADTSSWHGDIMVGGRSQKIFRLPDGSLFGAAGWKPSIMAALEWANAGFPADKRPAPVKDDEFDSIILRPDGVLWCMGPNFLFFESSSQIETVGSHHEFLYGAMLAGASAEEAVSLAIRHCAKAAGECRVERL